jgi:hypothetical protein
VAQNIPLLIYYRDNAPSIFRLVKEVAEELDVKLPVDTEVESEAFVMGERYSGKKDKVTNLALGMMKLYYYPSKIDLSDQDSKNTLLMLLTELKELNEGEQSTLKAALELSNSMIIKSKHIVDVATSMIMPKEIFVLQDEYGFDVGELSIELDEFYTMLEEKDLYSINDYIELAELDAEKKQKLLLGFMDDMQSVIAEIAETNNMKVDEVKKDIIETGKRIEIARRSKKITKEEMDGEIFAFATKYNMKDMYEQLTKPNERAFLSKAKAKARIVFSIETKTANAIGELYYNSFMENPIAFFEDYQNEFFERLYESMLDIYDDRQMLEEHIMSYREEMSDIVTPIYQDKVAVATAYSRMSEMLIRRYALMEIYMGMKTDNPTETAEKIYDKIFRPMMKATMGLKEHQISEAERYCAMEDEGKKLFLMAHEMRSGKTRTFVNTSYFLSLLKNAPINIIVESANMSDISKQVLESFPHLALRAKYFIDEKSIDVNPDRTFSFLPTLDIVPKPYIITNNQKNFRGGGKTTTKLIGRMGKDIDLIIEKLTERYGDNAEEMFADIQKAHKDSPFIKIMKSVCPKSRAGK